MATKAQTLATKSKAVEKKVEVNGSYDILINHFEKPSTIIDAATALADHNKIDPQIAAKKVEQFLENAKLDRTLEVRAGTGNNEGQYLIARVPEGAQKGSPMKAKVAEKKVAEKKVAEKKVAEKKVAEKKVRTAEGKDKFGFREGGMVSKSLLMLAEGKHTMGEVKKRLGGTCYSALKVIEQRGFKVERLGEGKFKISHC